MTHTPHRLFPYQTTGVDFLLAHNRCLLADEQGLGKTIQAVTAATQKQPLRIVIICPASLRLMWQEETAPHFSCLVVSYNYLQKVANIARIKLFAPDLIICDEAHKCKNFASKTCNGLFKILTPTTKVWLLTGTPATKSGQDYYPYLEMCMPGQFGTFAQFSEKFCAKGISTFWNKRWKKKQSVTKYIGVKPEMRDVLGAAFKKIALRRRKSEVLPELPPKLLRYQPVEVDEELIEKCKQIPPEELARAMQSENPPPHIAHLVREVGEAKVEAAIEFIENCGAPLIVFCVHHSVVDAIAEGVTDRKIGRITGKQSAEEKNEAVRAFQAEELDLIIATIAAGGTGITLTAASNMLFAEMTWSPAEMAQSEDRINRIGAVSCSNIVRLVAKGTLDDSIIRVLGNKQEFMREVMGDGTN